MYNNPTTTNTTKVYKASKNTTIYTGLGWGVYTICTSSCESATPILFTSIILRWTTNCYNSLHRYSPISMLTKKELLTNGIPPSETTQKNLTIRLNQRITKITTKTSTRKYQTPTRSPMIEAWSPRHKTSLTNN